MRSRKSAWELRERDLPPAWMIAREPRLAGMADNAVFRAALWRRRRKRGPEPLYFGMIDRRVFLDLLSTGLPARDYACGLWGAAAAQIGPPYVNVLLRTVFGLSLASSILVPFDRFPIALPFIILVLVGIPQKLMILRLAPLPSLLMCAEIARDQREAIERKFHPILAVKRALRMAASGLAHLAVFALGMVAWAGIALNHIGRRSLPLDVLLAHPLARLAGPALAGCIVFLARRAAARCRRLAEPEFGEMVESIDAILKTLASEESLEKAGIKKK